MSSTQLFFFSLALICGNNYCNSNCMDHHALDYFKKKKKGVSSIANQLAQMRPLTARGTTSESSLVRWAPRWDGTFLVM